MAGSRTLKLSILGDVDNLNKSLKAASDDVETFGDKITKAGKVAGAALAAAAATAGAFAIKIGIEAVKAASDLSETVSKVGVLFGDTANEIEKFAESAAGSLGQTKQQALDAAATFATFGKAAGLSGQDLSKFSIDFVKLSSDLASFNNTSPEQAINAIGAALRGEAEPLRAYGVLLDDASMRQKALELGIISSTKNALTPQQKVLAAQALIYEQTSAAQGDFERTSDGLANKTRILTAQLENAKTTIGQALLPIVLELATFIGDNVIPIVEKFTESFGDKDSALGGTIKNVAGIIKSIGLPIFEAMKANFDKIKQVIIDNKTSFEAFFDVVQYFAPILGKTVGGALRVIGDIAEVILTIFSKVIGGIKSLLNTAIDAINLIIRGYNSIPFVSDINQLSKIGATSTGGLGNFAMSTSGFVSPGAGTSIGPTAASIAQYAPNAAAAAAGIAALGNVTSSAASASNNIVSGSFGAGTFRAAEAASSGTTINLTVTGAIDKEGTARTIINTLNDSYYRGTGGATSLQIA